MNNNTTYKRVKITMFNPPALVQMEHKTLRIYRNYGWKPSAIRPRATAKRIVIVPCNGL